MGVALSLSPAPDSIPVRPRQAPTVRSGGRKRRWSLLAVAAVAYAAYTAYLTWPLMLHPGSTVFGPPGDLFGGIATMRELVEHRQNPFAEGRLADFAAPEGSRIAWEVYAASLPSTAILYGLTAVFGAVGAVAIFTVSGYVASATAMFALLRRLGTSTVAALTFGWAFAFFPFLALSGQHPQFLHGWLLVLVAWRMLELSERPSIRNGILAGAAAALTALWTPYFALLGGVVFGVLFAFAVIFRLRRDLRSAIPSLAAALAVLAVAGIALVALRGDGAGTAGYFTRALDEYDAYSARPLELLLAPAQHPVFGSLTGDVLAARRAASTATLQQTPYPSYLGISVLVLAVAGFVSSWLAGDRTGRRRVVAFAALVVVAVCFAGPPRATVGQHVVVLPSRLIYEFVPAWRVVVRLVVPAMLGLTVLAALGMTWLSRRWRWRRGRGLAASLALAAVVFVDLGLRPPARGATPFEAVRSTRIEVPRVYEALRGVPPGIVAHYPINLATHGDFGDLLFQDAHGLPVLGGYGSGSPQEARAVGLARLDNPGTADGLRDIGVRYVLLRATPFPSGTEGPGTPTPDFREMARDEYGTLYELRPRVPPRSRRVR